MITHLHHEAFIIVLNGIKYLPLCVEAIYPFFEKIWIVEGAERASAWLATDKGLSIDGTTEWLQKKAGDPKISYIPRGLVEDKVELCNAALEKTGNCYNIDYVWEIDSDEIYSLQDLYRLDEILYLNPYEAVEVRPYNFFHTLDVIGKDGRWEEWFRRIWKFEPGYLFASHRPPAMQHRPYDQMDVLKAPIPLYHLSYIDPFQVKFRCLSHCLRGYDDLRTWYDDTWRRFPLDHDIDTHPTSQLVGEKGSYAPFDIKELPATLRKLHKAQYPINILHILPSLSGGGACRAALELIRAGNPSILNQHLHVSGNRYPQLIDYDDIPMTDNIDNLNKFDVIAVHWWHDMDAVFDKLKQAKNYHPELKIIIIVHIFNKPEYKLPEFNRWNLTSNELWITDRIVWTTDKCLKLFDLSPEARNKSVYIPVGPDLLKLAAEGLNKPKHETINVGIPGPFYRLKIVPEAIDILKQIDDPRVRFHMLSLGGEYHDRFREQTAGDTRFVWFGFQKRIAEWLRNLDWLIGLYPHQTSCSCELLLQEAMVMKIPILMTLPEGLIPLFQLGRGGSPYIEPSLQAIPGFFKILLSTDPASINRAVETGFQRVLRDYGAHNSIKDFEALYRVLLQ